MDQTVKNLHITAIKNAKQINLTTCHKNLQQQFKNKKRK